MANINLKDMTFYCTNEACGDPINPPALIGQSTQYKRRKMILMHTGPFNLTATLQCPVCSEKLLLEAIWLGSGYREKKRIHGNLIRITPSPTDLIPFQ